MPLTRWEQVTRQDLTEGHTHPVNKEPTNDYMPQVMVILVMVLFLLITKEMLISIQMGPMVGRAVTVLIEPSNAAHKVLCNIGDQFQLSS